MVDTYRHQTSQRAGQLNRIAGAIRVMTYLSMFAWAALVGLGAGVGALFAGGVSAGLISAFEAASGQIVADSVTASNLLAISTYVALLLPALTIIALHLALLGFARLLNAMADHVTWLEMSASVQFEDVPKRSYSMWE